MCIVKKELIALAYQNKIIVGTENYCQETRLSIYADEKTIIRKEIIILNENFSINAMAF